MVAARQASGLHAVAAVRAMVETHIFHVGVFFVIVDSPWREQQQGQMLQINPMAPPRVSEKTHQLRICCWKSLEPLRAQPPGEIIDEPLRLRRGRLSGQIRDEAHRDLRALFNRAAASAID